MAKKFTDEEYYKNLPKKQVGNAVLFFNSEGELLILKPNYKNAWLVPGGSNDNDESPLKSALREVKEEIGLEISEIKLVGVYYQAKKEFQIDSLKFIFSGGILSEKQISEIKLEREELDEYRFVSLEKALEMLSSSLQKSIPKSIEAMNHNTVAYIE